MFKLFVGGMENVNKVSAIQTLVTDEDELFAPPVMPKVLYAVGVPIIWFWGEAYADNEPEPELPPALSKEYFSISFVYTDEELEPILLKKLEEDLVDAKKRMREQFESTKN